ncbi:unnamed protein product [Lampetra planeri]
MLYVQLVLGAGTVLLAYHLECSDTFPVTQRGFFCWERALAAPDPGPEARGAAPPAILYPILAALPCATVPCGQQRGRAREAHVRRRRWRQQQQRSVVDGIWESCARVGTTRRAGSGLHGPNDQRDARASGRGRGDRRADHGGRCSAAAAGGEAV